MGNCWRSNSRATALSSRALNQAETCSKVILSTTQSLALTVIVGAAGKLFFSLTQVEAQLVDIIRFNFLSRNYYISTQSLVSQPCTNVGGFSTGFKQFNPINLSARFLVYYTVDDIQPQWFYCAQTIDTTLL
jgi:hypothetical protein